MSPSQSKEIKKKHKSNCHAEFISASHKYWAKSSDFVSKLVRSRIKFGMTPTFKPKSAFTLAETLITLAIIGIIAALTIPILYAKYQKAALKSQFSKSYSVLQNTLKIINTEQDLYSSIMSSAQSLGNDAAFYVLKPTLMEKLKVSKDGHKNNFVTLFKIAYKNINNTSESLDWGNLGQFALEDSTTIYTECSQRCTQGIYIFVDINGYKKKPNRNGVDLFCFEYNDQNKLAPCKRWGLDCSLDTNGNNDYYSLSVKGFNCTKQAISDPNYFNKLKL